MRHINDLLQKFHVMRPPHEFIKKTTQEEIKKICGFEVAQKEIDIKNTTINLKTDPKKKNIIFLHKKIILEHISQKTGGKTYFII